MSKTYIVKKQGRQWGVFCAKTGELVEGGFFARAAAVECCAEWNKGQVRL